MIAPLLLAVALDSAPPVVRASSAAPRDARYVRLRLEATVYGVPGHGEIVVDRTTGTFVRWLDAGPVSGRDGWNGTVVWHADATGMPRVESNPDERAAVLAWARLFSGVAPRTPQPPPSRAPDATVDRTLGETTSVAIHNGPWSERVDFGAYRAADGLTFPGSVTDTSQGGTWSAHVTSVETPRAVATAAFDPPPPPDDTTLHGVSTLPFVNVAGAGLTTYPIVALSIDGAPAMRFVLDTGGQNAISADAARRLHLDVVGSGTVTGVGTALQPTAFAEVRTMRLGTAELRDQPFYVLDFGNAPFDGIIGYEVLARLAARVDFVHARVDLARDVRDLSPSGVAVRMAFDNRQPQVDGALDGVAGTMTIDTGSAGSVDVESPFAVAHDLRARMRVLTGGAANGVGGSSRGTYAQAKELRLGTVVVANPLVFLSEERSGGYADPTIAANVGDMVFRRFALVFDYRGGTIHFESPAP